MLSYSARSAAPPEAAWALISQPRLWHRWAPHLRGAHVSLRHPEAWRICRALIERAQVVPDFRGPDSVRLGFSPLTTSHADVVEALLRLRDLVPTGVHLQLAAERTRVT